MSQECGPWVTKPRQYRPSYSYFPSSTSRSNFTDASLAGNAQQAPLPNRRRTLSTFPAVDPLRSAPTVASSALTASVLSHDISHPTPKAHRLVLQQRTRTPTRIPTPTISHRSSAKSRTVSSPATSSSKENVHPITRRLLGPIQPGQPQHGTLTKSRTMNVLSSLTSPFTRSAQSLVTSRASLSNLSAYTLNSTTPSSLPLPVLIPNIHQISTSMPIPYWLGRFQALHDRYRADNLDPIFLNSRAIRQGHRSSIDDALTVNDINDPCQDDEILAKKVLAHLEALCTTPEARKNLKAFQQAYARKTGCHALLPAGGSMVDGPSLMAKAGRLFSGGRKSSFGAGMLKKRRSLGVVLDTMDSGV